MDAQNATESIATKHSASSKHSPSRSDSVLVSDQSAKPQSTPAVNESSSFASVPSSSVKVKDPKSSVTASQHHAQDDDAAGDNNSEAETIVLAGKNGSPVKSRKIIKREDNSDHDQGVVKRDALPKPKRMLENKAAPRDQSNGSPSHTSDGSKRKRLVDHPPGKDASRLNSAQRSSRALSSGRPADSHPGSDSESVHAKSAKPNTKERERDSRDKDYTKAKSADRPLVHKRKAPRGESDDEAEPESHKARRQRTSASIDASLSRPPQKERDHPKLSSSKTTALETPTRNRSISPHPRTHRRSASTQIQSSSGLGQKKKRPPPLSTEYHSDESSGSGSPHIRSANTRGLATPATADYNMSSARNPGHKKHVDAHGQTPLAKACSRGDYEAVKKRLDERPGDLNYPDYAGNTPLQIAALNGYDKIVKVLVDRNCDVDCVNHDKDTPLLDAVDNGHLGVVKALLKAGVDPRKANVNGEEPLDRVDDEWDNAQEIREALLEARKKNGETRKTSEERQDHQDTRSSHGADSPRRSPAVTDTNFGSRRAASSRSHKLSNSVLYMAVDDSTLRKQAGLGNIEQVQMILQVRAHTDDPPSMVAAARGGHADVMNLLLALGGANPDPPPVRDVPEEFSTPILAAIGQTNTRIIELLLAQSNFDPTKKFQGKTYYEIARQRGGACWEKEVELLKDAYDKYKLSRKDPTKRSPNRKEQESKRSGRTDFRDESSKASKRKATSPGRDSVREGQRVMSKSRTGISSHVTKPDEPTSPSKRAPGRPKKDGRELPTISISDGETSPPNIKTSKPKRPDLDSAALSSEGEANKPRRKLMSGRDIKEQKNKNRRASMVSNSSSLREPSSPRDARHDDPHQPPTEKYHDRAKVLKRDESRDRLSVSGENSSKRSRTSATPDRGTSEKEGEQPVKKRKLDGDKKERVPKPSSSPDRNRKQGSTRDVSSSSKHDDKPPRKHVEPAEKRDAVKPRKPDLTLNQNRRESGKSASSDKSIHVKSEDSDVVMRDADSGQSEDSKIRAKEDEKKRRAELEVKKKEKEAEERKRREEQERREAEAKRKEEEEKEKQRVEEEERKKQEDIRKRREEEAAQQKLKEEEQRKAEEARIRLEKEEEERKKWEEEERARKEREVEEARRKREDEERKEQERRARDEQRLRRQREEAERKRLEKLPAFLRWLDRSSTVKTAELAHRWRVLRGVRLDSLRPDTAGTEEGREQWVLNTQVAMLLGESDILLTRFSGWDHVPAPEPAKYLVMGLAKPKPALLMQDEWDLGREIPDYYFGKQPDQLDSAEKRQLEQESKAKFLELDSFFVKVSDLMFAVPNIPHLRNIEIVVSYHEVAATLEQHDKGDHPKRWKDDPDSARYKGFTPQNKYYVNGQLVREGKADVTSASYTPWPEARVPRYGLTAVPPTDPNYARLAKEQGLGHLLSGLRTPPMTTAASTSPSRLFPQRAFDDFSPPQSESTATANGDGHHPRSSTGSTAEQDRPFVNGNTEPTPMENGVDNS